MMALAACCAAEAVDWHSSLLGICGSASNSGTVVTIGWLVGLAIFFFFPLVSVAVIVATLVENSWGLAIHVFVSVQRGGEVPKTFLLP